MIPRSHRDPQTRFPLPPSPVLDLQPHTHSPFIKNMDWAAQNGSF